MKKRNEFVSLWRPNLYRADDPGDVCGPGRADGAGACSRWKRQRVGHSGAEIGIPGTAAGPGSADVTQPG